MRRRRFTRCILRSEAAITSGALDDARSALEEARQLIPDASEIVVLDGRMAESRDGLASSTVPVASALSLTFEEEDDDTPTSDAFDPLTTDASQATPAAMRLDRGRALFLTGWPLAVVPLALAGVTGHRRRADRRTPIERGGTTCRAGECSHRDYATSPSARRGRVDCRRRYERHDDSSNGVIPGFGPRLSTPQSAAVRDDEQIRAVLKRYESAYNRINAQGCQRQLAWRRARSARADLRSAAVEADLARRLRHHHVRRDRRGQVRRQGCLRIRKSRGAEAALRYWAFDLRKDADGWRIEQLKVE